MVNVVTNNRVKEYRKMRGLTQKQLAELSGVKRSLIARYETQVIQPSITNLAVLGIALDIDWFDLMNVDVYEIEN